MAECGLHPKDIHWDGRFHRFPGIGQKGRGDNGWLKAFADQRGAIFGDNRTKEKWKWPQDSPEWKEKMKLAEPLTREEVEQRKAEAEKQRAKEAEKATRIIRDTWERAQLCPNHPYLEGKGIRDVKVLRTIIDPETRDKLLLIPMRNHKRELINIQRIWPDGTRKQMWQPGGSRGLYDTIGAARFREAKTLFVCEGWATGYSIHQATNCAVIVAFFDSGLRVVGKIIQKKYPDARIIIAADNDRWKFVKRGSQMVNPGVYAARDAAEALGVEYCIPDFEKENLESKPTDYDDLRRLEGEKAVLKWLDPKMAAEAVTEAPREPEAEPEVDSIDTDDSADGTTAVSEDEGSRSEWFDGLPPEGEKGPLAQAINVAIDHGVVNDLDISQQGQIMFHRRGTWYPPEPKRTISRVAIGELYGHRGGDRLGVLRDAFEILASRIQQNAGPIEFDANPYLVGLPAEPGKWRSVLDLRDGEERKARRSDYVTRSIGTHPDAISTPLFNSAMTRWSGGDEKRVRILRRLMASCLVGLQPERALFFLLGPRGSGKSAFARLVEMMAPGYVASLQASDIGAGKLQKADELIYGHIAGNRGVFVPELPPSALRGGFLKAVCGGDAVQVRRLYNNPWSFVPGATLMLITNALPGVNVLDPALVDRVRVIQFPETFKKEEKMMKADLLGRFRMELPGILNGLLPDATELIDDGMSFDRDSFATEDSKAVESWALSADKLMGFGSLLEVDSKGRIPVDELWERFREYWREVGGELDQWQKNTLSRELTKRGFGLPGKRGGQRLRLGVRWKTDSS